MVDDEIVKWEQFKKEAMKEGTEVMTMDGVVFVTNTEGTWDRMRLKKHLTDHDFSPILFKSKKTDTQ
mgnify:CR=1 FL=1